MPVNNAPTPPVLNNVVVYFRQSAAQDADCGVGYVPLAHPFSTFAAIGS
jgi:hypothetical protein